MGLPIIVASAVLAPVGAWCTTIIPGSAVMVVFTCFLIFSGAMLLFYRNGKYAEQYRETSDRGPGDHRGRRGLSLGLLGVGGGGEIRRS